MTSRDQEGAVAHVHALDAVQHLQETLGAYRALGNLLDVPEPVPGPGGGAPPEVALDRGDLGALVRVLNTRLAEDLGRAEAAVQAG